MRLFRGLGLSVIVIFLAVILLGANGDDVRFEELGRHRLICACGCNQILLDCNHVGCTYSDRMRQQLSAGLQSGASDENILAAFVKEYGTTVLAAPGTQGFDRVAWIMPFAVFLAALLAAAMLIRNWRARTPAYAGPASSSALDQYRDQARKETEL